jgi:Spx/MgsR family transcriptional regulator
MKRRVRFLYKSTCTTSRDARAFVRNLKGLEIDERDYAKTPLTADELREIFRDHDPRDFLSTRSPAYKAMGLAGKSLTRDQAIALMVKDSNLLRRPLVIAGKEIIAGFDRDRLGKLGT